MCAQAHRADVVARVAEYLRFEGLPEVRFEVKIRTQSVQITIVCEEWPEPTNSPNDTQKGSWVSPIERRILDYLSGRADWTPGETIAQSLGEPYQHRFKAILTNLVDRSILEAATGSGYRFVIVNATQDLAADPARPR